MVKKKKTSGYFRNIVKNTRYKTAGLKILLKHCSAHHVTGADVIKEVLIESADWLGTRDF